MKFSLFSSIRIFTVPLFLFTTGLQAGDWEGDTSQDWNDANNWSGDVYPTGGPPAGNAIVNIDAGNFPIISADTTQVVDTFVGVGAGNTGRVDHQAGIHSSGGGNWSFVGTNGGTGTYNLAGTPTVDAGISGFAQGTGTFNTGNRLYIGGENTPGTGTFNMNTSGSLNVNELLYIGIGSVSQGTLNLQSGTINSQNIFVGESGKGTFTMTGGLLNNATAVAPRDNGYGDVRVGNLTNGDGFWDIKGDAEAHVRGLFAGTQTGAVGRIDVGGTAQLISDDFDAFIGQAGTGTVNVNGGTVTFNSGWTFIGTDAGGDGAINVSGGSFSSQQIYIGQSGSGTVSVSGSGLFTANDVIIVAQNTGSTGEFNISGGTADTKAVTIGNGGLGTATISGGQLNTNGDLVAGNGPNRGNELNITGTGDVNVVTGQLWAGQGSGNIGTINIDAGSATSNDWIAIGREEGTGLVNISGTGVLQKAGTNATNIILGSIRAHGTLEQTGGQAFVDPGAGDFRLGEGVGSVGIWNLSGGTASADALRAGWVDTGVGLVNVSGSGSLTVDEISLGEQGPGTLNVLDGGSVTASSAVNIGNGDTGTGALNLLGGTLYAPLLAKPNTLSTGRVTFNGGTLKASAASTTFLEGLTSAIVHAGGAKIDTNGFDVTINQALEAPTGMGLSSAAIDDGGSGYVGNPLVQVNGDGTGASAVVTYFDGELEQVIITNPGINYTSPPSMPLIGAAPVTPGTVDVTSIAVTPNVSGGLTKTGLGTLVLNGENTYTGETRVMEGTLQNNDTIEGPLTINPGASYTGCGDVAGHVTNNGTMTLDCGFNIHFPGGLSGNEPVLLNGTTYSVPPSAPSAIEILSVGYAAGTFTMSIQGITGLSYQMETSTSLESGSWSPVGAAQTGTTELIFSDPNADPFAFYRIVATASPSE